MGNRIYIIIPLLALSALLIYSSINEYNYLKSLRTARKIMENMSKGNPTPEEYGEGFEKALAELNAARKAIPERAETSLYLGKLYQNFILAPFEYRYAVAEKNGITEESALRLSVEFLERAVSLNPRDPETHLTLAWIYNYLEKPMDADQEIFLAEKYSPNKLSTLSKLLEWSIWRRDLNKAEKLSIQIYLIHPGQLNSVLNIVWRGYQDYEVLKKFVPENAKSRVVLVRFLKSKGMADAARAEEEYARTLVE